MKALQRAAGLEIPPAVAPLTSELGTRRSKKPADVAFALHQKTKREEKIVRNVIKRLGDEEVEPTVAPSKMNIQFLRNVVTSRLKYHYGMLVYQFLILFHKTNWT